ncbi:hypothetical protein KSS87_013502 [Heliosperma pusillum]|nr:hypothetical protein KSS87_013502 [Heliosperma pusillum]
MYAETGLMFPYFQNFSQEVQSFEELCYPQKPCSSLESIITTSAISDYDLGGEGDLFKAPEAIIEESMEQLDPVMTAALSMMSCGDDVLQPSGLKIGDIESMQNEQLFSDAFDGCRKELFEKTSIETPFSDVMNFPLMMSNEAQIDENKMLPDLPFTKSDSSESLSSMEWVSGANVRPDFLDFPEMDAEYGMRRAFSEGDIKTLANDNNISLIRSPLQRQLLIGNCTSEERLEKLSRYRNKKSRRNFGRKIKYACRKALADSQPRVRGRFAKTEDTDSHKKQYLTHPVGNGINFGREEVGRENCRQAVNWIFYVSVELMHSSRVDSSKCVFATTLRLYQFRVSINVLYKLISHHARLATRRNLVTFVLNYAHSAVSIDHDVQY